MKKGRAGSPLPAVACHPTTARTELVRPKMRAADLRVCCVAGFQTRITRLSLTRPQISNPAGLETGDTAGLETCGTRPRLPTHAHGSTVTARTECRAPPILRLQLRF